VPAHRFTSEEAREAGRRSGEARRQQGEQRRAFEELEFDSEEWWAATKLQMLENLERLAYSKDAKISKGAIDLLGEMALREQDERRRKDRKSPPLPSPRARPPEPPSPSRPTADVAIPTPPAENDAPADSAGEEPFPSWWTHQNPPYIPSSSELAKELFDQLGLDWG
jgi:hypothetical protein